MTKADTSRKKKETASITPECIHNAVEAFLAGGGKIQDLGGFTSEPLPKRKDTIDPGTRLIRSSAVDSPRVAVLSDEVVIKSLQRMADEGYSRDRACRTIRVGATRAQRLIKRHPIHFKKFGPQAKEGEPRAD